MTRLEKWTVWSSTIAMAVTGLAIAFIDHFVTPSDEWALVNHPARPWLIKAHILAAPVLVFGLGLMAARHILPRLRSRPTRRPGSGALAAWVIGPMVGTGYLLQVLTSETPLTVLGYIHLAAGIIFSLASVAHAVRTRRRSVDLGAAAQSSPRPSQPRPGYVSDRRAS